MRLRCLTQEHNTVTLPGFDPGPLTLECSTLTIFSILSLDVVSVVVLSLYSTYICSLKFPLAENSIILMEMMMGVGSPNQLLSNIRLTFNSQDLIVNPPL